MNWTRESSVHPRKQAEREFEANSQQMYRVTTIKWGYSDYEHTLNIDNKNVRKFTYTISLQEFITEWMEHFNQHPDEDIIMIEKMDD